MTNKYASIEETLVRDPQADLEARDSVFSTFLMRPALNGRGLCDMEYNSELLNHVSKNEKSWNGEHIPIIIKIKKPKLKVQLDNSE